MMNWSDEEKEKMIEEMLSWVRDNKVVDYTKLKAHAFEHKPDTWYILLCQDKLAEKTMQGLINAKCGLYVA